MVDRIENARNEIINAMKQGEKGLLYIAIDNLLPDNYDKEDLIKSFVINKHDDKENKASFQTLFEKDGSFFEKYKKTEKTIVASMACIGLHFSQKKDKLQDIKEICKDDLNSYFYNMLSQQIYIFLGEFIHDDFGFDLQTSNPEELFKKILEAYNLQSTVDKITPTFKKCWNKIIDVINKSSDKEKIFYIASVIIGMAVVLGRIANYEKVKKNLEIEKIGEKENNHMANNARKKIQTVLSTIQDKIKKSESGLLYTAIDELLPPNYDKENLFEHFQIRKNSADYSVKDEREFIAYALAFIGRHFSRKSDNEITEVFPNKKASEIFKILLSDHIDNRDIDAIVKDFQLKTDPLIFKRKHGIAGHPPDYGVNYDTIDTSRFWGSVPFQAFIYMGAAVIHYPKKFSEKKENIINKCLKTASRTEDISPLEPIHIIMMLILPANKLGDINKGDPIDSVKAVRLIDDAVYFGCFPQDKANNIETELELKDQDFSQDTVQDIFISLKVKNGEEIIKKSSMKFSLKKYLRNNQREFTISKIRLLKKRYGLEKLNYI
ncbi:MAG: hypothetical protein DRH26_04315 [Deltaproteobacteria bacterium]|nr:MAG: hypothetical protein DRH26_04315 [Deltaproteobacteria bacterium]